VSGKREKPRHRRTQHVAGEFLSSFGILGRHAHLVMRREPGVAPGKHAATKVISECRVLQDMLDYYRYAENSLDEEGDLTPERRAQRKMRQALTHHPPDTGRIGRWKREVLFEDVAKFERIVGSTLA